MKITSFLEIIEKIKISLDIETDKQVAIALNIDTGNYSKLKKKNSIPFKNVVECCIFNNIDLNYIFKNTNISTKTKKEEEILELISKLNEKEQDLYIFEIKARILRKELDK